MYFFTYLFFVKCLLTPHTVVTDPSGLWIPHPALRNMELENFQVKQHTIVRRRKRFWNLRLVRQGDQTLLKKS